MADFNPNAPQILGQEWVPIKDVDLAFNPFAYTFERGYGFTNPANQQVSQARFALNTFPNNFVREKCYTASVYPRGQEAASGPVRSVIIPCNAGGISGTNNSQFPLGIPFPELVFNPSSNYFIDARLLSGQPGEIIFFFAVNNYLQLLQGKRILGVDFISNMNVTGAGIASQTFLYLSCFVSTDFPFRDNYPAIPYSDAQRLPDIVDSTVPLNTKYFYRARLGDINRFYGAPNTGPVGGMVSQWTYPQLQRFEASSTTFPRLMIRLANDNSAAVSIMSYDISYAALQVYYCEESRVLFGSRVYNTDRQTRPARQPLVYGENAIILRSPTAVENSILPPGDYTVTINESNMGDDYYANTNSDSTPALLNQVRQLYTVRGIPGVQVNIPFPLNDDTMGLQLTQESTAYIPQISLHASGGDVIPGIIPYGQQSAGQVYGNNIVTQEINDGIIGGNASWPWVRYYARRFGNTQAPLRLDCVTPPVSGNGVYVQITPGDFDALDEIIDGWKEVTLRFPTAPVMGSGATPTWRWSASNELAGNRWEVLGATAPAISGFSAIMTTASNAFFNSVPTGQQLWSQTYGAPVSGAGINEDWMPQWGPYVTGTTPDNASDMTVLFAQDMPGVTGFTVSVASQAVTGIGLKCGIAPPGIPTAILYNQITWTPYYAAFKDVFERAAQTNSWGTTPGFSAYPYTQLAPANQYGTDGQRAFVQGNPGFISEVRLARPNFLSYDQDFRFDVTLPPLQINANISTSSVTVRAWVRQTSSPIGNSYYEVLLTWDGIGNGAIQLNRIVGATTTNLQPAAATGLLVPSLMTSPYEPETFRVRAWIRGNEFRGKAWKVQDTEPEWQVLTFDTAAPIITGGGVGLGVRTGAAVIGPSPATFYIDNVKAAPIVTVKTELQRMDPLDTDWHTIMLTDSPYVYSFNDYEARIGLPASYRIRFLTQYDFPGPWSNVITTTIPTPGVSGTAVGPGSHIMVFSTNEIQTGFLNVAYSNAWEQQVREDFTFPEAGFVQMQQMFGKDFFTAFHPTERGGDQFSRDLLVQAAAIAPETLADFTTLRNMAWSAVSYICVRDEDGNRWFANVQVQNGNVQDYRKLYQAHVQINEVTSTPSQVDPDP